MTRYQYYGIRCAEGNRYPAQVLTLGVIDLRRCTDPYLKLKHIYERVQGVIASYLPDELAIEAPFFGKNVQSMLKLGRAQGVAIVAALCRDIPVTEYAPLKIKMAITGNGQASKEQVADMLKRMLHIPDSEMGPFMDAPMPWGQPIAITCRWGVRLLRNPIPAGKILLRKIPTGLKSKTKL